MSSDRQVLIALFERVPNHIYKRIFNIMNPLLLSVILLITVDYVLPRRASEETVTEVREVEYDRKGKSYMDIILYTSGPSADISDLSDDYRLAPGDTVQMESTPLFGIVYGLGVRNKKEAGQRIDMYRIRLENGETFLIILGIGVLLLLVAMIPKLSYANRGSAAFFAYVMLYLAYSGFDGSNF